MRPTDQISGRVETAIRKLRLLAAASCLLLAASRAQAQFPGDVPDTFRLNVGGMYAWFGTDVTFQEDFTPGGPIGAGINLEDLGAPKSRPGFSSRGYWNPFGRFFIDFGYTGFDRESHAYDCLRHPVRRCDLHRGGVAGNVHAVAPSLPRLSL